MLCYGLSGDLKKIHCLNGTQLRQSMNAFVLRNLYRRAFCRPSVFQVRPLKVFAHRLVWEEILGDDHHAPSAWVEIWNGHGGTYRRGGHRGSGPLCIGRPWNGLLCNDRHVCRHHACNCRGRCVIHLGQLERSGHVGPCRSGL